MSTVVSVNRRGFLKATGATAAGLLLGFTLPERNKLAAQFPVPAPKTKAYIHIGTDDRVTFILPKAEMGQGPVTSLSQLLADELDADWNKIRVEFAPVDPALYGPVQGVVGSMSVRTLWEPLRQSGAMGRDMLREAAAQKWGVPKTQTRTENGFVVNTSTNARLSYGSLAEAASRLPDPQNVALKDPKDFRYIGKPVKRLDTRAKSAGQTQFGIDTRLPDMAYAVIARCPVFGGKVASFDGSKAMAVPGVKKVAQVPTGVAVIADSTWAAMQGRRALEIKWDEGKNANLNSAGIRQMMSDLADHPGAVSRKSGDADQALKGAAKKIEAVYDAPYLSHAPMEPMNCTVKVTSNSCEIWASTQMQTFTRDAAAKATGLNPEQVTVHTMYMGGGFGRRANVDYVGEAVEVARAAGVPVKLTWSREDDMQHDSYRPASVVKFAAGLDADGWPVALHARISCPSFAGMRNGVDFAAVEGIPDLEYEIPNFYADYRVAEPGIPTFFWRAVGYTQNTFFAESFLDELAASSGKDPVEFRRKLLAKSPRLLNVLNLVAEKANWGKAPAGRYQGVAIVNNIGSYTAQVAEISVNQGKLKVHKVVCAVDCGHVVNPAILTQQIQSGIVYGLSATLKGAITIDHGRVQQGNFNTYDLVRMDEMPLIEVHIVSSAEKPGGIGEASVPPIAPAVTNAIFAATGKRIRKLPLRNQDLA